MDPRQQQQQQQQQQFQQEQHKLSLSIQHVNQKLDPIEQSLLDALEICESNCRLLDNWSHQNQDMMFQGINKFVEALEKVYVSAGHLPPHYTADMPQLLSIDSGINPAFTVKNEVDQAQLTLDLNRGTMAQVEIFRDTFDSLVAEWIDTDAVNETKHKFAEQEIIREQAQQRELQQQQQLQTQQNPS